jgi:signal transduction histidine kinase
MKRHIFIKYTLLFLVGAAAVFLLFGFFFFGYMEAWVETDNSKKLEESATSINQDITTMLLLTQQDFDFLVENQRGLLEKTFSALRGDGELELFLTDHTGKILLSTPGLKQGEISAEAMNLGTKHARAGEEFFSDLDGFYSSPRLFRVVLLEKEHSQTNRQRVGAVYLSIEPGTGKSVANGLLVGFLLAVVALTVLGISFCLLLYRSFVRPLALLNEGAEKFAKGDFSQRLPEEEGGEITPLVRAYNQMAQRVEENEKVRQTFVSNVSHDLRTPLTTIGGFVQNMMHGTIPPEKYSYYFKIVLDEVNRLSRLVQTLLETSRMSAGERKYNMQPMDLCELGRITLLSFEAPLEQKRLEVSFDAEPDSIFVFADRDAIQQVIYNLMDNAIKFTPEEGRFAIKVSVQEKKAIFSVENSGDGIPPEELSHLFDRFYKSDRSRGLDKKGMGLGLFIAKSIISAHSEEIWVESQMGRFTRFVFSLPLTNQKGRK